jgi:hypothetical protein
MHSKRGDQCGGTLTGLKILSELLQRLNKIENRKKKGALSIPRRNAANQREKRRGTMKNHTFTKSVVILISIFIILSTFAVAGVIHVPQDQPTIQEGINASAKGDTVLVSENTYYENISFVGKAITVASHFIVDRDTSHINNTIIDGSRPSNPDIGSVVSFVTPGEDTTSVLMGFTITGGTGTSVSGGGYTDKNGGDILIRYPGAKIVKNKIINNHITTDGDIYAGGAAIAATNAFGNLVIRDNMDYTL